MLNYYCLHFDDLNASELFDVLSLRQQVFIIEQKCIYPDVDLLDKSCYHVLGQDTSGQLLGYARIIPGSAASKEYVQVGRVVTAKQIRKTGEGRKLMAFTMEFARALFGDTDIFVSAQTYLVKFYRELGFASVSDEYLEDGIAHVDMILKH